MVTVQADERYLSRDYNTGNKQEITFNPIMRK